MCALTHLVDVGPGFGWCLDVLDSPLLGLPSSLIHRYLPTLLQVGLVPDHKDRDLVLFRLHPQDLLPADSIRYVISAVLLVQITQSNKGCFKQLISLTFKRKLKCRKQTLVKIEHNITSEVKQRRWWQWSKSSTPVTAKTAYVKTQCKCEH